MRTFVNEKYISRELVHYFFDIHSIGFVKFIFISHNNLSFYTRIIHFFYLVINLHLVFYYNYYVVIIIKIIIKTYI